MKVLVKKMITTFEFQVVDYKIPQHGTHQNCTCVICTTGICKCTMCVGEAINLAIKRNDWYCNDDEYETKFETEIS